MPADIYKSALLILSKDSTSFLACMNEGGSQWLMPGGKIEAGEAREDALVREIQEELSCELDKGSINYIGDYEAPAAGQIDKIVHITLYTGVITGEPTPSSEIKEFGWLSKEDADNPIASETIRLHIIPDLVRRGVLK